MKKIISTPNAPKAIGPYSQAVLVDNTLYCSGQIAINPKLGKLISDNISAHNKQPGTVFLIDPISANLETVSYEKSLSIPKIPKTENTKAIKLPSVIIIDKEGQFYRKFNTFQNQMA